MKETTSLAKIEANRENALKSTGPRTAEGKRRSRWNALKHGLLSQAVVRRTGRSSMNCIRCYVRSSSLWRCWKECSWNVWP